MQYGRNNLFTGLVLILIGVVFLLINYDVVDIDFRSVLKLWPLILVGLGISALMKNSRNNWVIAVAVVMFFGVFFALSTCSENISFNRDSENKFHHKNGDITFQEIEEKFSDDIETVEFSLEAVAGKYTLKESTENLIYANIESNSLNYMLSNSVENGVAKLSLELVEEDFVVEGKELKNSVELKLNKKPVYLIKIDAGASKLDLDLSNYKIQSLDLDAGAASIDLIIGEFQGNTDLNFDLGASKLRLDIPKEKGCRITVDMGLSSKDFDGFKKVSDGVYQTDNYGSAVSTIEIHIDAGLANIDIDRY